jgi:hypothetical protein
MEQLEQLEGRIVKALELISDLRVENSHLESELEKVKANNDQLKLTTEEKIRDAARFRTELDEARMDLEKLQSREKSLEDKISEIIHKLDGVKSDSAHVKNTLIESQPVVVVAELEPESVKEFSTVEQEAANDETPSDEPNQNKNEFGEDEIVLLDDEEDEEVIITDEDSEDVQEPDNAEEGAQTLDDDEEDEDLLNVFQDDEDDLLIVEEDDDK